MIITTNIAITKDKIILPATLEETFKQLLALTEFHILGVMSGMENVELTLMIKRLKNMNIIPERIN